MVDDFHQDNLRDDPARANPVFRVKHRLHQAWRGNLSFGEKQGSSFANLGDGCERLGLAPFDIEDLESFETDPDLIREPQDFRLDPPKIGSPSLDRSRPEGFQDCPIGASGHGDRNRRD